MQVSNDTTWRATKLSMETRSRIESEQEVKAYIQEHDKLPSDKNKDANIKILGQWLSHQQVNHKKLTRIMKDDTIRNTWTEFITTEPLMIARCNKKK